MSTVWKPIAKALRLSPHRLPDRRRVVVTTLGCLVTVVHTRRCRKLRQVLKGPHLIRLVAKLRWKA